LVRLPGVAFGRKETMIVDGLKQNLALVRQTEQELSSLVLAVAKGDSASCIEIRGKVFDLEAKSAAMHRELGTQIAEGAFFGGVREDMLNLVDRIHKIADKAKDAARLITLTEITDAKSLRVIRSEDMEKFLESLDKAVVALQRLIEAFEIDRKTMLERVHSVEEYEEAADTFKQQMLESLFERTRDGADPLALIMVRDFLFSADDVADGAEDASDVVLVLVAKGYG
jgi:predicted phosphate transport protein (TIGR00153 family)